MKKMVLICMVMTALLLCSCATDSFVAAPIPGVGSVVVASNPVGSSVGVVTPGATVVYSTSAYPRTYVSYPYGYYSSGYTYYAPTYRRRLPPPPPPRKRARRR